MSGLNMSPAPGASLTTPPSAYTLGAILANGRLIPVAAVPTADATQAQFFTVAGQFGVLPGSSAGSGIRVYDPADPTKYLSLRHYPGSSYLVLDSNTTYGTLLSDAQVTLASYSVFNMKADMRIGYAGDVGISENTYNGGVPIAKVTGANSTGLGWMYRAGFPFLASNATAATNTMASLTLSSTLVVSRSYSFRAVIYCANSVAAEGVKIDFDGGSAVFSAFRCHAVVFGAASVGGQSTTAIATDITVSTITGDACIVVTGWGTVSTGGTFIPRFSSNAYAAGTVTVYAGSHLDFEDAT